MPFAPKDMIDQMLTAQDSNKVTLCTEVPVSAVDPERMISAMQDAALMTKTMFDMSNKIKALCSCVTAKATNYRSSLPA